MFNFFRKIFPSKHEKDVKLLLPLVEEINAYYEEYQKLTDDELRQKTQEFKELIKNNTQELEDKIVELQGKLKDEQTHQQRVDIYRELEELDNELQDVTDDTLNEILSQAFAVVKDTCRRLCGKEWLAAGNKIKWNMIPL